ncbi:MAG TPA: FAD-dependent oxidoreductase [Gemmatimonadales bacterium]|nr:FAD-dependent oxidoreductase [Gemmatimonadales bacterium]
MRPEVKALGSDRQDLVVVGGGILGACLAWDAALRGLKVALVERGVVGCGTSANSLRIIHGGLRYLIRGDLPRMRESIRERSVLLRIAPGLVEPLPVAIPSGIPGYPNRSALRAALALNDLISAGRNRHLTPDRRLPSGRSLSALELRRLCPGLGQLARRGGALWYDARMSRPEQLTRAFVRSATERGALVAENACADRFTSTGGRVLSVAIRDCQSGGIQEVAARRFVLAAGPWTGEILADAGAHTPPVPTSYAVGLNLVIGRRLADSAVGLRSERSATEDPVGGGRRFLFLVPQEGTTLVGTWYGSIGDRGVEAVLAEGRASLLQDLNRACPGLELADGDVVAVQWGRLPVENRTRGNPMRLADRPRVIGPAELGVANLYAAETVKYTTARAVAERVLDRIAGTLAAPIGRCRTAEMPLAGAGLGEVS